jgi:hypothetical protein
MISTLILLLCVLVPSARRPLWQILQAVLSAVGIVSLSARVGQGTKP